MSLSEIRIKSAKPRDKRYQLSYADGLYLEVMASGKKYWRLRYFYIVLYKICMKN
jgi:hypothetical protein